MEKLVRDRIKEIMEAKGLTPQIRIAKPDEMLELAMAKFFEEVEECKREFDTGDLHKFFSEICDVHDVLELLIQEYLTWYNFPPEVYQQMREKKWRELGTFANRHVLTQK